MTFSDGGKVEAIFLFICSQQINNLASDNSRVQSTAVAVRCVGVCVVGFLRSINHWGELIDKSAIAQAIFKLNNNREW